MAQALRAICVIVVFLSAGAAGGEDDPLVAFREHCGKLTDLAPESAKAVSAILQAADDNTENRRQAVDRCLAVISPAYKAAAVAIVSEEYGQAVRLLGDLTAAKDPWLKSNAKLLLAKALCEQEQYEKAIGVLEPLAAEKPARIANPDELDYLLGRCQAGLLRIDEALQTLTGFAEKYPTAPFPIKNQAARLVKHLHAAKQAEIAKARGLMDWSRRRLKLADPGEPTQAKQGEILSLLDQVIKKAEEEQQKQQQQQQQQSQNQQQGQGQGQGQMQAQGQQPGPAQGTNPGGAKDSNLPGGGQTGMGTLGRANQGRKEETWGNMPAKEREKIMSEISAKFPSRYQALIQQYYKSLQEEE